MRLLREEREANDLRLVVRKRRMAARTCSAVSAAIANSSLDPQFSISSLASKRAFAASRSRRSRSIRLLRAMVKIHVETPPVQGRTGRLFATPSASFPAPDLQRDVREAVAHQGSLHPRGEVAEQLGEGGAVPVHGDTFQQTTALLLGGSAIVPIRRSQGDNPRRARGSVPGFFPDGTPPSAMTLIRDETLTGSPRIDPE